MANPMENSALMGAADENVDQDAYDDPNGSVPQPRSFNSYPMQAQYMNPSSQLSEHALTDSPQICVGASVKQMRIPARYQCIRANPQFMIDLEWASRCSMGALLAALPALLEAQWVKDTVQPTNQLGLPTWFDQTYAAVAFVFTFGFSVGETSKYIFQAMTGAITAAIVPQLAINTFGDDLVAVLLFMFFYSLVVLSLPVEATTKKFALGMCVEYLMERALPGSDEIPKKTTYQVVLLGLVGCGCSWLMCIVPYPRTSINEAFRGIRLCITDIQFCTRNLVDAYMTGENLQDRARTLKYFEHLMTELKSLDKAIEFAWWEPWAKTKAQKYKAVLQLIHKLRTDLFGMQKALMERKRDGHHKKVMNKICAMFRPDSGQQPLNQPHKFSQGIRDLMLKSLRALRAVVQYVAGDREQQWATQVSRNSKDRMRSKIESDIQELSELRKALARFHQDYAVVRRELSQEPMDRLERDKWLNVFLFNLTSYSQALMDFPEDYAASLEIAQSERNVFLPETKMVTLHFQKRQLVSAAKSSAAITAAAGLNAAFFKYSSLAPKIIAYIMGGHIGGSWFNTANRVVGLISGMILAYVFTIFSECNTYALGTGFSFVVLLSSYVRVSSPIHSYTGMVSAFIECLIMLGSCSIECGQQLETVQQVVLSCLLISVAELIVLPSSSGLFFRKQVADTLLDCLSVFGEVEKLFEDESQSGAAKNVEHALWRNLPASLQLQETYLHQAAMEPALWQPEVPFTAYQKLIFAGRRLNLHLILLFRALARMEEMRTDKKGIEQMRDQKLLLDDLVSDDGSHNSKDVVKVLCQQIRVGFEELSESIRADSVTDKEIDQAGGNVDEIDDLTRNEMVPSRSGRRAEPLS
jgi:hypothetical protein